MTERQGCHDDAMRNHLLRTVLDAEGNMENNIFEMTEQLMVPCFGHAF